MKEFRVLVLDDMESRHEKLRSFCIAADYFPVYSALEAIELLEQYEFGQIFLDHDLSTEHYLECIKDPDNPVGKYDNETGYAVAKWLAEHPDNNPKASIIVHSCNPSGAERMFRLLRDAKRDVRRIPFDFLIEIAVLKNL